MTTYRIQWKSNTFLDQLPPLEWHDIPGEEFRLQDHAELRKSSYWDKLGMPLEFRVEKGES